MCYNIATICSFIYLELSMSRFSFFVLFVLVASLHFATCQNNGGVSTEASYSNNTTVVDGKVASLVIEASKKVLGNAVIRVTLTNTEQVNLKPALTANGYCYKFTVLNNAGAAVKTVTFGLDKFRKDFGSDILTPGIAHSEFEYVLIKDLMQFDGGSVRVEAWLAKDNDPSKVCRVWGETKLENIFKALGQKIKEYRKK